MNIGQFILVHGRMAEMGEDVVVVCLVGGKGVKHDPVAIKDNDFQHDGLSG